MIRKVAPTVTSRAPIATKERSAHLEAAFDVAAETMRDDDSDGKRQRNVHVDPDKERIV